jgi:hypothetical protein
MNSEICELPELEIESVSGGFSMTIDFGYVQIHMGFPSGETGPASGAMICGSNGCITEFSAPSGSLRSLPGRKRGRAWCVMHCTNRGRRGRFILP